MRILCGVSSERTEHVCDVLRRLAARGHEVTLATAGHAAADLLAFGFEVIDLGSDVEAALETALRFEPHVVLADHSYFACLVAHLSGVPVVPFPDAPPHSSVRHKLS